MCLECLAGLMEQRRPERADGPTSVHDRSLAPYAEEVQALNLGEFLSAVRALTGAVPGVPGAPGNPHECDISTPGLTGNPWQNFAWISCGVQPTLRDAIHGAIGLHSTCVKYSTTDIMTTQMEDDARRCTVGLVQILRRAHHQFWEPDTLVTLNDPEAYAQDPYKLSCDAIMWLTAALDWVMNLTAGHFPHMPYLFFVWALL